MTSIIISDLSWTTEDGSPVFAGLNITFGMEKTGLVGRNGVGKTTLMKIITGDLPPADGSVIVDGKVGTLRQAVQVADTATVADLFLARAALALLRKTEAGNATVEEIASADWLLEDRIKVQLARLGVDADTSTPLTALSGGQRTRAALAAVMFAEPDFILLDEPTNNLDRQGRMIILDVLSAWKKGAVVVSHDRELLEIMDAIVEMSSLGATRYGGNWTDYRERKAVEISAAEHDLSNAEKRMKEVNKTAQIAVERKDRRDAVGARRKDRGDLPKIILGNRKNAAEASGGDAKRLADRRKADAAAGVVDARAKFEVLQHLSIALPSTGLSANRQVLQLDKITAGYNSAAPTIRNFSLSISGPERLALVGPNGSGKTTLLKVISGQLESFSGDVLVSVPFAFLDQGVGILDPAASIRDNFMRINTDATENDCRSSLASFLFRADAALQTVGSLSGGQLLRAGLACVLGGRNPPALLILDEPTNHLDVESVEAIEDALKAYDGALLVVSHDNRFLGNIRIDREIAM
jgi:ATPase subunit of ABC transporter with duplicated ATPase domains